MKTYLFHQAWFWLIIIIAFGLFLRIFHMEEESMWLDEGHSIRMAGLPVSQMVDEVASNKHPPFYFICLHGWIHLFGESEFSARALSALFGVLSIVMIYRFASLLYGKPTGLLAALLLSLSRFNIYYSQEIRMYSLLTFLSLGSMYFFTRFINSDKWRAFFPYLIFSALLVYTQNFGLFIVVAQNAYLFLFILRRPLGENRHLLVSWIILQGLLLVFYLPWLGILVRQVGSLDAGSWNVPKPTLKGLVFSGREFSGSRWLLWINIPLVLYAFIPSGKRYKQRREKEEGPPIHPARFSWISERLILLVVWLFSVTLLPFLISLFSTPIYVHRATIIATLPWLVLVSRGIERIRFRYLKLSVIMAIIVLASASIGKYYAEDQKDQWREAVKYLAARAEDGDLILVYGGSPLENIFPYYYRKSGLINKKISVREMSFAGITGEEVTFLSERFDRIWVILSHIDIRKLHETRDLMEEKYHLVRNKRYFNYSQDQFHRKRLGLIVFLFLKKGGDSLGKLFSSLEGGLHRNLVRNPGFEKGGEDWPEWVSSRLVEDRVHSGERAARIDGSVCSSPNFWHLRQELTVPRGRDYIFGAYVYSRGLSGDLTVEIKEQDGDPARRYCTSSRITGSNDWMLLMGPYEAGPGSDPAGIEIRPGRMTNFQKGIFWVDDVFLFPYD